MGRNSFSLAAVRQGHFCSQPSSVSRRKSARKVSRDASCGDRVAPGIPRRQCLVAVPALVLLLLQSASAAGTTPGEMLAILRARDAQFENVSLSYVMRGTKKQPNYSWKIRMGNATTPSRPPAAAIEYEFHDKLVVRGNHVTFHRSQRESDISRERPWKSMIWNNFDGIRAELVLYDERFATEPGTLEVFRNPVATPDGEIQHQMWVEFALGFGFGKRLTELDSVEETDIGWVAEGTLLLWRTDVTHCVLTIDRDYIVRKAVLDADVKGSLTHIETESSGVSEREGFLFAERGHYLRRLEGRLVDGVRRGTPKIDAEYDIEFVDAAFHLDDEQFRGLTRIVAPLGTNFVDPDNIGIRNVRSVTWQTAPADADQSVRNRMIRLAFLNGIVVTVVLFLLWLGARRKKLRSSS